MHDACVRLLQAVLADTRTARAGQDWVLTQFKPTRDRGNGTATATATATATETETETETHSECTPTLPGSPKLLDKEHLSALPPRVPERERGEWRETAEWREIGEREALDLGEWADADADSAEMREISRRASELMAEALRYGAALTNTDSLATRPPTQGSNKPGCAEQLASHGAAAAAGAAFDSAQFGRPGGSGGRGRRRWEVDSSGRCSCCRQYPVALEVVRRTPARIASCSCCRQYLGALEAVRRTPARIASCSCCRQYLGALEVVRRTTARIAHKCHYEYVWQEGSGLAHCGSFIRRERRCPGI